MGLDPTTEPSEHDGATARARIAVVGSYNLDTALELAAFPVPGETVIARGARKSHGGKGSNQAVQAARCGGMVSLIACVGNDAAGRAALDFWRMEGMAVYSTLQHKDLPTGTATILVDRSGENLIVVNPGANLALTPDTVLQGLAALHPLPAILVAQLETSVEVAQAAFRWAREAHATTILNAAPVKAPLTPALIDLTDILVINEIEALALVGSSPGASDALAAARRLASQVGIAVVLTRGAAGATLFGSRHDAFQVPSPPAQVRDTTGAGDAFIGAFAAQYAANASLEDAVKWGVAAGSFACRGQGAVPSYGTREEIGASFGDLV